MATRQQCERALDRFADDLARRPNVVGLGIVPLDPEAHGDALAVGVYISRRIAPDRLRDEDRIPSSLELPGRRETIAIPTRVIEQGPVSLEAERL